MAYYNPELLMLIFEFEPDFYGKREAKEAIRDYFEYKEERITGTREYIFIEAINTIYLKLLEKDEKKQIGNSQALILKYVSFIKEPILVEKRKIQDSESGHKKIVRTPELGAIVTYGYLGFPKYYIDLVKEIKTYIEKKDFRDELLEEAKKYMKKKAIEEFNKKTHFIKKEVRILASKKIF